MFWNFITLFGKCVQVWSKKWNIMMQILSQTSIVTETRSEEIYDIS